MDAHTTALTLLSRRELSTTQLRARLVRRGFADAEIENTIARLASDRTLDDHRVAVATARIEGAIRHRGRRRVLQRVQQLGVSSSVAEAAVDEVFQEIDERASLERAVEKRLQGKNPRDLDPKGVARIVRSLIGQGFEPGLVYSRLRVKTARALPGAE